MARNEKSNCCCTLLVLAVAVGMVICIHTLAVQIATYDSHPDPACQHFPTSMRCVKMNQSACMEECKPPNLAIYAGRRRAAKVIESVLFYALERSLETEKNDAAAEREFVSRILYGANIVAALAASDRRHLADCVSACIYVGDDYSNIS
jgi:hypothetical protein